MEKRTKTNPLNAELAGDSASSELQEKNQPVIEGSPANNNITIEKSLNQKQIDSLSKKIKEQIQICVKSADKILTTDWPEPVWAVPGLLPVGLTILAGAPKVGKSWLALQIAQAVASGGGIFGNNVEPGPVLYLALEDSAQRLKNRMKKHSWPPGLNVHFYTIGDLNDLVRNLEISKPKLLSHLIEYRKYRLVVIDTLSRVVTGNQKEVEEMTVALSPIQEIAHKRNCAIVIIDHHRKGKDEVQDAISDILGSTAKGAMADTVLGLYRDRNKLGAKLSITGRDVEERTIDVMVDKDTWIWQLVEKYPTEQQREIIDVMKKANQPIGPSQIGKELDLNRGTVHKQLVNMVPDGLVKKEGEQWTLQKL